MKKFAVSAMVAAAALVLGAPAHAVDLTGEAFTVTINLTPKCMVTQSPGNLVIDYVSNASAAQDSTDFKVQCTSSLDYTLALAGTGTGGVYAYTDSALELDYTLTIPTGATGDKTEKTHSIVGEVLASQWGKCATPAGCNGTAQNHTLTVSY
jgi:hypothetical protein